MFLLIFFSVVLKENEREKGRERERIFYLQQLEFSQDKAKSLCDSFWLSQQEGRNPSTWTITSVSESAH